MLAKNDLVKIYETVLSIPGMNEEVKVSLKISRKNLLLLHKIIERGLNGKEGEDKSTNILDMIPKEILDEIGNISGELLKTAGLAEMNEKLKSF